MLTMTALGGCAISPRGPKITAIDTHAHVFAHDLPLAQQRRYAPDYDAPLQAYLAQLDAHGISHGVLIQVSFLGTDNRYLLNALAAQPGRLRGVAVIDPAATDAAQLDALARGGIVGIRLNLFNAPDPDYRSAAWQALLPKLAALGWQVEVHCEARRLPQVVGPLLDAQLKVVVDHFGRPDPALGIDDPGFRYLLTLGPSRRVWVKLSGAYRNGPNGVGEAVARAATPRLKDALGLDRLMWGSDWPHTQFERRTNYDDAYRLIHALLPDPDEQRVVLADTPARLFGFA
ncbi:amidohydrolase family protein [Burkholderia alba]|uniref:amidohydrolase family protein n=1 Tax=Burkholderia alba TaxID=2683677 RepID=UPI002B05F713|nr:amidohydrolase family protein [Burkholderia alba]